MASWTFITNHGIVFLLISKHKQITAREIAAEIGITERSVLRIINDLDKAGYIDRAREGRRNRYTVKSDRKLRHELTRGISVLELLNALTPDED